MEKKSDQEACFDVSAVVNQAKTLNSNIDALSSKEFVTLCLMFTKLSSSMGKLVSWGFQDIFCKCRILSEHIKNYPELPTLQGLIEKEMALGIHILSGSNNEKYSRGKDPIYAKYESGILFFIQYLASRTILRLLWFLTLIKNLLKGLKENPKENMSSVGRTAYNNSIAPWHPFMLRNAIRLIFYTVPTRKHFIQKTFGDITDEAFAEIAQTIF